MSAATLSPSSQHFEGTVVTPVSWKGPIAYGVIGLLSLIALGFGSPAGSIAQIVLSQSRDSIKIDALMVPARATVIVLSLAILVLAAYASYAALKRIKVGAWMPTIVGVLTFMSFLIWAAAGKDTTMPLAQLLAQGLILAVPLAFGAMAGLICERVGIINIAIEGQLLAGAFVGAVAATVVGNAYAALFVAPFAGALVGVLLAFFSIKYRVDQIVVGVVLNVLVIGVTSYLFSTVLKENKSLLNQPERLGELPIPLLSDIPFIGGILFNQNILVYLMFVAVIALQFLIFRSRWGLRLRSVGEHPKAADTVGIKVNRTRWINTIIGGAVAGLGGVAFTVMAGVGFGKEMTAGKGYIALAAMILGRWNPNGAFAAAILFGIADALRGTLSITGTPVPTQFLAMLPYLATIFAVAGLVGKVRAPAAEGIPYVK
ncbi:ABC transporter permease [Jonesia quinghaiensis]|uniref:ABC transporter permease n=1 Tax=Jonesia quinghaiensis TaxID=262806 RepID=UPI0003FE4DEC|nr:ABC transporter permease [Jonesia quinghaiensis]